MDGSTAFPRTGSGSWYEIDMTTLGFVLRPQFPPERFESVIRTADEAGLDELWLWEDCFFESGIAPAAAALAWTTNVRIGIGLLPVPLRNVALSAMEVATIERMFPGRSMIAWGHGAQDWMGQAGARVESPLTLLREYLTALRRLLDGEKVTVDGRYVKLDDVQLTWPAPAKIWAGAIGPKSVALCGELADGVVIEARAGVDGVARARDLVGDTPITVYVRAAIGDGAQERIDAEKTTEFGVANDDIPVMVERLAKAGADAVILQPTEDEPDLEGLVRYTAGLR
jgi:alkanesulfonate monooxygenase SsuD/methylene tetrahydromethanopterin reductase-like flavin-dependent oxidoreductase (luciferase family)